MIRGAVQSRPAIVKARRRDVPRSSSLSLFSTLKRKKGKKKRKKRGFKYTRVDMNAIAPFFLREPSTAGAGPSASPFPFGSGRLSSVFQPPPQIAGASNTFTQWPSLSGGRGASQIETAEVEDGVDQLLRDAFLATLSLDTEPASEHKEKGHPASAASEYEQSVYQGLCARASFVALLSKQQEYAPVIATTTYLDTLPPHPGLDVAARQHKLALVNLDHPSQVVYPMTGDGLILLFAFTDARRVPADDDWQTRVVPTLQQTVRRNRQRYYDLLSNSLQRALFETDPGAFQPNSSCYGFNPLDHLAVVAPGYSLYVADFDYPWEPAYRAIVLAPGGVPFASWSV